MKIYFAGSSRDWRKVRTWIERAKQCGHTVTFDWTKMVETFGRGDPSSTDDEILIGAAVHDMQGVKDADILVLFPDERIYGAMAEMGGALATNTPVWIIGTPQRFSVFFRHPHVKQISEEELADALAAHMK